MVKYTVTMLLLFSTILFAQNSKSYDRNARIKEAMERREAAVEKRNARVEEAMERREAYFKEYAKTQWTRFLKVPGTSLPKSPDSLNIKTVDIPKIKPDENPNIEIIDALLKEGINEKQAVNIALEIIDSLGIDAIKEGQSIGIFTEKNNVEKPVAVSYMADSLETSTFLRNDKADGYKYFEADKKNNKSGFATNSQYEFPLKSSCRKTSGFGMREHPILGKPKKHDGVDYGTARGNEVYAIADGAVIESSWTNMNGNYIVIKHADGMLSYYLHLNEKIATKGNNVKAGQIIGKVGSTGQSTGPHLHLGIKKNSEWQDPEKVLNISYSSQVPVAVP